MAFLEALKEMHRKKMVNLKEIINGKPERIDTDFPMNIRLNCIIQIERTPFILAGEDKLCFSFIDGDYAVEAVGRYNQGEIEFFNFYLRSGSEEAILQIARNLKTKQVLEATYYREIYQIFPEPEGEFGDWRDFVDVDNLRNPQCGVLGCYTFETPEGNSYEMLFPNCPGNRTTPFSCVERITDDPLIPEIINVDHYLAVYGRNVDNDFVEKLLVSKDEDSSTASIRILAGIPIDIGAGTFGNSGFLQVL